MIRRHMQGPGLRGGRDSSYGGEERRDPRALSCSALVLACAAPFRLHLHEDTVVELP